MNNPIITVASGKGGTGKTTVASCLALSASRPLQFFDCDVEEPNASIFLKPEITHTQDVTMEVPEIDYSKCTLCGKCAEICMYNALAVTGQEVLTFTELCHSCGGCWVLCPENAVNTTDKKIGIIQSGKAQENIHYSQGQLEVGAPTTPPLIKAVKNEIREDLPAILDAPPGTSCPVVEALEDTHFALLVTEPTGMGLNDLALAVELTRVLNIPCGVIINRASETYDKIDKYCEEKNIPVLLKIPADREIAAAYSQGTAPVYIKPELKKEFQKIMEYIERVTSGERTGNHQR